MVIAGPTPSVTAMRRDRGALWTDPRPMSGVEVVHTTAGCISWLPLTSPKVAKSPRSLRTAREHPAEPTGCENDRRALCPAAHRFSLTNPPHPLTFARTPCAVSCLPTVPHTVYAKEPADVVSQPFSSDAHHGHRAQHPRGPGRRHCAATTNAQEDRLPGADPCTFFLGPPARGGGVPAAPARTGVGRGSEPHH